MIEKRFPGAIFMKKLEKEFIPLIFLQMNFDGSSVYQRLDTGELVSGEYIQILLPELKVRNIAHDFGKIKFPHTLKGELERAKGMVLGNDSRSVPHTREKLYDYGQYCHIDEKALQKQDENSELGSGLTIE